MQSQLIGLLFLVPIYIYLLRLYSEISQRRLLRDEGLPCIGQITKKSMIYERAAPGFCKLSIEYTIPNLDQKLTRVELITPQKFDVYDVGSEVELRYLPSDPNIVRLWGKDFDRAKIHSHIMMITILTLLMLATLLGVLKR